jgi:hypothetical protein
MYARDLDSSGKFRWPVNPIATVEGRTIERADAAIAEPGFETCSEPGMLGLLRTQLQNLLHRELGNIHGHHRNKLRDNSEVIAVPR